MGKRFDASDMPPLSREFHDDLRGIENQFGRSLNSCISSGNDLYDPNAAFEYARTYAIEFFDHFYDFYSQYPDYREHWGPASAAFALQRVIHCLNNYSALQTFFDRDRVSRITRTISDHAKRATTSEAKYSALIGRQAASYAKAGIDIASGSPLLLMAHEAAQRAEGIPPPGKQASTVPALTVPKRRIPRSIHSESAAKKLEDYLNAKGLSQTQFATNINVDVKTLYRFRTTGKVGKVVAQAIALAMGITLDEFIGKHLVR